jgi:ketosteroid isomerase-like protein
LTEKETIAEFFKYFSNNQIDQAFELVSDDVIWWVPGTLPFSGTKTKDEYLKVVGAIKSGFPDGLKLNITSMISENGVVAAEVESLGQHVNGKPYTNKYHFLIQVKEGKMVHVKEYMDTLHLHQLITP